KSVTGTPVKPQKGDLSPVGSNVSKILTNSQDSQYSLTIRQSEDKNISNQISNRLPKTGENKTIWLSLLGAIGVIGALFGLSSLIKKKNE
ncbi:LPXTG cell wall anchor domain-containing protein, partial [Enterococcus faecium]|nr:LPXTG cell wall anchor domain-containing protein [Enterococcus faecium]